MKKLNPARIFAAHWPCLFSFPPSYALRRIKTKGGDKKGRAERSRRPRSRKRISVTDAHDKNRRPDEFLYKLPLRRFC